MTKVVFTSNIQRHVGCPEAEAAGRTVREVLEHVFAITRRRGATCSMTSRHCAST
jgi:hypothetical protein